MPRKLEIEWLRLETGSVRHAVLPAELLGYVPEESFRGLAVIAKRRLTLCGRMGQPNMEPYIIPVYGGRKQIDPARFKHCVACTEVVAELLFTTTGTRRDQINKILDKIAMKRAKKRHKERTTKYNKHVMTRVFSMRIQISEKEGLGGSGRHLG